MGDMRWEKGDRRQDRGQEMGDRTEVHKNVDFVIKM